MKITLHVGPHKTGTTSIQSWMLENSTHHLQEHGIYYPEIQEFPPGHAVVAWQTIGLHKYPADPAVLNTLVDDAAKRGAKQLVLSSEEFCIGLKLGTLENLRVLNERGPVELIVTLTPLPNRFVSEVCEDIKHAATFDLDSIDVSEFCLSRPGLWPDLLHQLRDGIRPAQTHVILGEKKHPNFLIESFAEILGIPGPENLVERNQRFPHSRTRLLNFLNAEFTDIAPKQKRKLSGKLNDILQAEGLARRARPIGFSDTTNRFLSAMWNLQLGLLQALHQNGDIRVYGETSLECMQASSSVDEVAPSEPRSLQT